MLKTIDKKNFPSSDEIFTYVRELCRNKHRKSGTPEGLAAAEYIRGKFKEFGLQEVAIEKEKTMCMFIDKATLMIDGVKQEVMGINGTNRPAEEGCFEFGGEDEIQEFVYLGKGEKADFEGVDVKGKVVVCDIYFNEIDPNLLQYASRGSYKHDPGNKIVDGMKLLDIYSPNNWPYNYFIAEKLGAIGFIGILRDYVDDPYWYSEDYTFFGAEAGFYEEDVDYMSMPGMWISKSAGDALVEKFSGNKTLSGNMQMISRYEYHEANNVRGIIPGKSGEIVMIHSHHDAVFEGGVQDASGCSVVLTLAEYFSKPGNKKSDKTYMFATMDTHFTDYEGHVGFAKRRTEAHDNIVYDLVIEHLGQEAYIEDGKFVYLDESVAKVLYVSNDEEMLKDAIEGVKRHDLDKVVVLPVMRDDDEYDDTWIITDGYLFEEKGAKIVSVVSSPPYLFHPSDTPDKVRKEDLQPFALFYAEMAESL